MPEELCKKCTSLFVICPPTSCGLPRGALCKNVKMERESEKDEVKGKEEDEEKGRNGLWKEQNPTCL
uniref:Uncharacterized protein n=1 Tax=Vespula pensylvanica TaxID=30213 RepID=A0A834PFL0_VESPE|nr:hypothetical protein H0235_001200 [Vespula pensylvanica]